MKASSIFTGCTVLCAGLVWLFINCTYCIKEAPYVVMPGREVAKLIKQKTASDDSVLFLSTWPSDPYPVLLETNHRSGCRYPFIYPLQLLRYCRSISTEPAMLAHYVEEERRIADEIASDIKSRKPKLIFIRSVPLQQAHSCVSVVDFIKANLHLSDAIDQNYDQLSMIGALKVYERMR